MDSIGKIAYEKYIGEASKNKIGKIMNKFGLIPTWNWLTDDVKQMWENIAKSVLDSQYDSKRGT